jgi:pimeloyl-ACP methyl ester carboxylesterase
MPTINVLGVPHTYDLTTATPSKQVVVFIHGWLLSRAYWQPVIQLLSPDYPCLAYDLRGFGDSQYSSKSGETRLAGYSLEAYAKDLTLLLKELEIHNVWLVGHSLGGSIALWTADLLPQQVKGVICLNAGGGIYLKEEFERFRTAGQKLVGMRPSWLPYLPWLNLLMARMNVARAISPYWGKQRLRDFINADSEAALGTLLESTTEAEVHYLPQIVARLQQPVYFIAGAQDPIMEPKYVRHLASFHSLFQGYGGNVVEIANCGHMAMVEQPIEVTNRIREIFTQHPLLPTPET